MRIKKVKFDHNPKNPKGAELRHALIKIAKEYYEQGVPWRHEGRDRNGVDCAGLLFAVVREATGVDINIENYSRQPNETLIRKLMRMFLIPHYADPEKGDIFLVKAGYAVCHMGFFTGDTFIHADVEQKRIVEQGYDEDVKKNVMGIFRVPVYQEEKEKGKGQ